MKKILIFTLGLVIGAVLVMNLSSFGREKEAIAYVDDDIELASLKWEQLLQYLDHRYVDEVQFSGMTDQVIKNTLKSLDPHSYYVSSQEVRDYNNKLNGFYYGIGIETLSFQDRLFIKRVYEGTPAYERGLRAGDEIRSIDGFNLDSSQVVANIAKDKLKKFDTAEITLKIIHTDGEEETISIYKSRIEVPSVEASFLVENEVAYIRLNRFNLETYNEFMQCFEKLSEQGAKNLIIDLRDNPGGYLKQVVDILSQFYEEKDITLVSTHGVNTRKIEYKSTGKVFFPIEKIAVLTNANSASGSEVLAGAIQDTDRGIVVGEPSFGKGLVQERFELIDGSEIRLTTSRYYTPSGRSIQKQYPSQSYTPSQEVGELDYNSQSGRQLDSYCGILPDIYVSDTSLSVTMENKILSCLFTINELDWTADVAENPEFKECFRSQNEELPKAHHIQMALKRLKDVEKARRESIETDPVVQQALEALQTTQYEAALLSQ